MRQMAEEKPKRRPTGLSSEYLRILREKWWWIVATIAFSGGYDIAQWFAGRLGYVIVLPRWVPLTLGLVALFVAQFLAFAEMRRQRNDAEAKVFAKRPRIVLNFQPESVELHGPYTDFMGLGVKATKNAFPVPEGFLFRNVGDAAAFNISAVIDTGASGYRINLETVPMVVSERPVSPDFTLHIGDQKVPLRVGVTSFLRQGTTAERAALEFDVTYVGFERTVRFSTPHTLLIRPGEDEILIRLSDRPEPNPVPLSHAARDSAAHA